MLMASHMQMVASARLADEWQSGLPALQVAHVRSRADLSVSGNL